MATPFVPYNPGTLAVTNGSKDIVGTGTNFLAYDPYDVLIVDGYFVVLDVITDATQATAKFSYIGATGSGKAYEWIPQPDVTKALTLYQALQPILSGGNVQAFADLVGASGKVPIFTGAGTMQVVDRSEFVDGVHADASVDTLAERATYDAKPGPTETAPGFSVLVADVGDGRSAIYYKVSDAAADWSDPAYVTGPQGLQGEQGEQGPKGDTGDITGLTTYWQGIVTTKEDAPTSRAALGAQEASTNLDDIAGLSNIAALLALAYAGTPSADKFQYYLNGTQSAFATITAFARSLLDDADAAALWSTIGATAPADKAFRRGNVLGTVSQSAGVPTGALLEYGSNANGIYLRFADGTQIVAGNRTSFATGGSVTFPAEFVNASYLPFANLHAATAGSCNAYGLFTTSMSISHGAAGASTISFMAIGRWF